MDYKAYYTLLLDSIKTEATVARIVRGISWTAAVLSDGQAGVAMHTEGESFPRLYDTLLGLPAREAARAVLSWNMEEASEGMAVINACCNRAENAERLGCYESASALEGIDLRGKTVGFVGHLIRHSGITEELLAQTKAYYVITCCRSATWW